MREPAFAVVGERPSNESVASGVGGEHNSPNDLNGKAQEVVGLLIRRHPKSEKVSLNCDFESRARVHQLQRKVFSMPMRPAQLAPASHRTRAPW